LRLRARLRIRWSPVAVLALCALLATLMSWTSLALAADAPAPAAADAPRFDLLEIEVEGNTVLPAIAIEAAVLPFLGEGKTIADVDAARAALERAYQQAGYLSVFVDVPEQRVDQGLVRLKVLEGRVERLRVSGSRYFSQGFIRDTVSELAVGTVPNFNTVQAQVALLNRTEDRRVQPVLKPGAAPGTVDVDLNVTDRVPADASVEITNRHAAATTPFRLSASGHYNNLWQRGHSIGFTATTAPADTKQSRLLLLNYGAPLDGDASLSLFAVSSNSLVEPVSAVTVAGKGLNVGLRWQAPLPGINGASQRYSHGVTLGVDYKDFQTRTLQAETGVLTPLRYLPFQVGYSGGWQGEGLQVNLNTQFNFAKASLFKRSVDCADAGLADQFACSSQNASGSYAYWRGDLRFNLAAWAGSTASARLGWQLSLEPLVSNERYALGGVDSVRGYLEAEASGDRALVLGLEWRSANLGGSKGWQPLAWVDDITVAGFAEGGQVNVLNALPGQALHTVRRGLGLALNWRAGSHANGGLDLAWPLDATAENAARAPRLHFRLAYAL
jgi:hemolysin activation/secretion protein